MKNNRYAVDHDLFNLILCIGEVILGVLLLLNPIGFTSAVLITLGVLLVALGIARLAGYFRTEPALAARGGGLVSGLVFLLAGLFCIFRWEWFVATFPLLAGVYGLLTLVNGLNKLQWAVDALRLGRRGWYLALIGAAVTLLFGALILANPFATTAVLWTFLAVSLLLEAVLDFLALVRSRS